jgi:hypothetical protein
VGRGGRTFSMAIRALCCMSVGIWKDTSLGSRCFEAFVACLAKPGCLGMETYMGGGLSISGLSRESV